MIRPAKQTDAQALGTVYCRSWQHAYAGLMPTFFLDALTPENCTPKPDHIAPERRLVAEMNGEVVGTVTFGKSRDMDADGMAEIYALYVLPTCWKMGQGSALLRAAVDILKSQGYKGMALWALQENHQARAFYERMGMQLLPETKETELAGAYLTEVKYQMKW